ncbi:polysaccharide deacetylase family protein [Phenylobacterium sp.]|uniref:polysaccharide deacetylase family protein n=1 Tax=Phenylobacterium sp. TaxID=1871053 RepID=UPI00391A0841
MRLALAVALAALFALPARAQEVALTFDDLPAHSALPKGETRAGVARAILKALREAKAPAFGFVNGVQTEREPGSDRVLSLWRRAGHPLGNHTWSHLRLTADSAAVFEVDIVRNEPLLEARMGRADWRWFRYPYLAEGETPEVRARTRAFLKARGYRIASVTLDFADWAYNEPYARCRDKGDAAAVAALEARYLASAAESLERARALSHRLHGRDIPYVLLMHLGAFDARMAPRLLALYRSKGVRFVSLAEAEADPFYRSDVEIAPTAEPLTLEAEARGRGIEPAPAPAIADLAELCR